MTKHLLTLLILGMAAFASAQDNAKAVALLIPLNRPEPEGSLFPDEAPVIVIPFSPPETNPRELIPLVPSPSIRIKERFVSVTPQVTPAPRATAVPRWQLRKAIRSLDLARRYAPVYGTGTGVK